MDDDEDVCDRASVCAYNSAPPMQNTLCVVMDVPGKGLSEDNNVRMLGRADVTSTAVGGADDGEEVRRTLVDWVPSGCCLEEAGAAEEEGLDGVVATERIRSCVSHDLDDADDDDEFDFWSSSKIVLPNSLTLPRVTITFNRPANGRNFGGMLSHVFRPMINAFKICDSPVAFVAAAAAAADSGTWLVRLRKKAMSPLIPFHGRPPRNPMPIGGFKAVATTT